MSCVEARSSRFGTDHDPRSAFSPFSGGVLGVNLAYAGCFPALLGVSPKGHFQRQAEPPLAKPSPCGGGGMYELLRRDDAPLPLRHREDTAITESPAFDASVLIASRTPRRRDICNGTACATDPPTAPRPPNAGSETWGCRHGQRGDICQAESSRRRATKRNFPRLAAC